MRKGLWIGAAATAFWCQPGSAAELVTTGSSQTCSSLCPGAGAVQPFDSSLGTLTGITLQIDASYSWFAFLLSGAPIGEIVTYNWSVSGIFTAVVNSLQYSVNLSGSGSASTGGFAHATITGSGAATFIVDPSVFDSFIDKADVCGISREVGVCVSGGGRFTGGTSTSTNENVYLDVTDDESSANYTVTYTYDPGGVPEPSTWAMMLLGFGAIGASIRRRRVVVAKSNAHAS